MTTQLPPPAQLSLPVFNGVAIVVGVGVNFAMQVRSRRKTIPGRVLCRVRRDPIFAKENRPLRGDPRFTTHSNGRRVSRRCR